MHFCRLLVIFAWLASFSAALSAQERIAVRFCGGTYAMTGMREFQRTIQEYVSEAGVPALRPRSFPPGLGYQVQFSRPISRNYELGALVGYTSTDGEVYYGNSAGSVTYIQEISGLDFGVFVEKVFYRGPVWEWRQSLQISLLYSKLRLAERYKTADTDVSDGMELISWGSGFEAGATAIRRLNSKFSLKLNLGFYMNASDGFHLKNMSYAFLLDRNDAHVIPQWVGARFGAALVYALN